jgi:hypothetical protein
MGKARPRPELNTGGGCSDSIPRDRAHQELAAVLAQSGAQRPGGWRRLFGRKEQGVWPRQLRAAAEHCTHGERP